MFYGHERRPFKDMKRELVQSFERYYLDKLLERHRFNLSAVERSSGLSRKHVIALIHKHGLYERVLHARRGADLKLQP